MPAPTPTPPKLAVRGVSIHRGPPARPIAVLEKVSFSVHAGEFVSLVGPSGCGKSTLISILAGLERPDTGVVEMDGQPITGPSRDRTVVFQDPALFPWLTVLGNVAFGPRARGGPRAACERRAWERLRHVRIARLAHHYPHQLSNSMRHRAALARALAADPAVLLLDDPFVGIDAQSRLELEAQLQAVWQQSGQTVLLATHDIAEAVRLSDRIVLLTRRPGHVKHEFAIRLARPRAATEPVLSMVETRIAEALQEELDRIAEDELGMPPPERGTPRRATPARGEGI